MTPRKQKTLMAPARGLIDQDGSDVDDDSVYIVVLAAAITIGPCMFAASDTPLMDGVTLRALIAENPDAIASYMVSA